MEMCSAYDRAAPVRDASLPERPKHTFSPCDVFMFTELDKFYVKISLYNN